MEATRPVAARLEGKTMWNWINEYSGALSVLANLGMLVIWALYLQLFLVTFLRQRRANILVTRGAGDGVDARCLVSNMSSEPVYIQSVLATVISGEREHTLPVTDTEDSERADRSSSLSSLSSQGPLDTGQILDLGPFSRLIDRVLRAHDEVPHSAEGVRTCEELELTVIGAYGQTTLGVAAKRRFRLEGEDQSILVPTSIDTEQIRSRRGRRYVREVLAEHR